MAKSKSTITESYPLPSANSNIYGDVSMPKEVTLRAMTTLEEKMRLSSSDGFKIIPQIIRACCVDPESLPDIRRLKIFDLQYLMYKLRIVTYGPDYNIEINCPHCGKRIKLNINLDDIPVNLVPDNFVEPYLIGPLPCSGDTIGVRLLNTNDVDDLQRESRRILNKFPDYVGDPEFILKWNYIILNVNGEDVSIREIQPMIENMNARDLRYLESKYEEINSKFGLDLSMVDKCDKCNEDIEFELPMTSEFFRPEY